MVWIRSQLLNFFKKTINSVKDCLILLKIVKKTYT